MATRDGTKIGGTLTLLLVFVITIVVIVAIFAYFSGVFKFVSGGTPTMTVSGALAVSSTSAYSGNLVILVRDTSTRSIVGVTLNCPSSQFVSTGCDNLVLYQNGSSISVQRPLTYDQTGSGSVTVQAAPGTSFSDTTFYMITVTASFSDGSTVSKVLSLSG